MSEFTEKKSVWTSARDPGFNMYGSRTGDMLPGKTRARKVASNPMLRARPNSFFSWKFTIFDEADRNIAGIDIGWVREAGEVHLDGKTCRIYREHLFGGAFVLEEDGKEVARAEKPSALLRSFTLRHGEKQYILQAASPVVRTFVLSENDHPIGSIRPENALTRKALIDLPAVMPLPVRIFIVWLVLVLWKRDAESSS